MKRKSANILVGRRGERLAVKYLKKLKYKILETNYTNVIGEIDIIAYHKKTLIFVEVKAKSSTTFGLPREAVTPQKQQKIQNIAMLYIKENRLENQPIRFDVVDVLVDEVTHIVNAF